jgi:ABC-type sugar transport system permease subunit
VRRKYTGPALIMTSAFGMAEMGLVLALFSLTYWLAPGNENFDFATLFSDEGNRHVQFINSIAYVVAVLFLEPFYVSAGFGMYLNRRAELEAWDIEQEFRRAFAS